MTFPPINSRPGPPAKTGYSTASQLQSKGAVLHSAEGSLEAALAVLRSNTPSSWHFTIDQDGQIYQHYSLTQITWHAGPVANRDYIGIEHTGIAGEPLTGSQLQSLVHLLLACHDALNWGPLAKDSTLFEHNHFMATACPSGRIPWPTLQSLLQNSPGQPSPGVPSGFPGKLRAAFPASSEEIDAYIIALASITSHVFTDWNLENLPNGDRQILWRLAQSAPPAS